MTPGSAKPCDSALEHADGGERLLIAADFGVGHAGMVVDDGVHECNSDLGAVSVAAFAGALGCLATVVFALLSTQEFVPTAIGDVAELSDVDVDQRAGIVMFVAAQRFTDNTVDVR